MVVFLQSFCLDFRGLWKYEERIAPSDAVDILCDPEWAVDARYDDKNHFRARRQMAASEGQIAKKQQLKEQSSTAIKELCNYSTVKHSAIVAAFGGTTTT
ncbi:hypothetical protein SLEP1_g14443 [Rubroshorea leprosula]|uniref:Uncharacterized protein n=1 Tax=Rubroshorea leprosula TaxID=152421 RepID=A0AAV5IJ44_9ROSI|nr:hypothetical protein SLEP1_g14443 [Rubroshorea leprosula]